MERGFVWHDFHEHFIPLAAELINRQVLPRYFARIDEHVYLHELSAEERRLVGRSDVSITPAAPAMPAPASPASMTGPAQVVLQELAIDEERISYLEIRDRENRSLITVIELLSPANKENGPDRSQYLTKRARYLASAVHLVEIDLLRGGPRMPMSGLPDCDYCVLVSRAEKRPVADAWPLHLADPLPVIPIPLRTGEPDACLDLQQALHRVYDAAGYEVYIYQGPPEPPLTAEQSEWAKSFLPRKSG